jgi:hypothetical protein
MHDAKSTLISSDSSWLSFSDEEQSSIVATNPEGKGASWCLIILGHPAVSKYFLTIALQYLL